MKFRGSLGFKFFIGFSLMFIPLLFFLFYNNIYAMSVVRNQVATTNNTLLTPYVNQIDYSLQETSKYLSTKAYSDFDINTLNYYPFNSTDYVLRRVAVVNRFNTDMNLNNNLDALFIYKADNHDLALVTNDRFYGVNTLILFLFGKDILSLFTSNSDIISILVFDLILQPLKMANMPMNNALNAVGDSRYVMIVSMISMWGVAVTGTYVFGLAFGWLVYGVYVAMIADEAIRAFLIHKRWFSRKYIPKQEAAISA
jgi:hypothetical protein